MATIPAITGDEVVQSIEYENYYRQRWQTRLARLSPEQQRHLLGLEALRPWPFDLGQLADWLLVSRTELEAARQEIEGLGSSEAIRPLRAEHAQPPAAWLKRHLIEAGKIDPHPATFKRAICNAVDPWLPWLIGGSLRVSGTYWWGRRNAMRPIVERIELDFPNLPPSLEGFRLLHISDFHIDGFQGLSDVVVQLLENQTFDLAVFTGDYRFHIEGCDAKVYPDMQRIVSAIDSRLGIYGSLGNHDHAEFVPRLEDLGIRMLVNESAELRHNDQSFWLLGVDDSHDYDCADLHEAAQGVPLEEFKILLAHAPELMEEAAMYQVQLCLGGHTHGGQICLPNGTPIIFNARCDREYGSGLWKYQDLHGYTSRGIGTSICNVRFFCPPEITVFELKRGEFDV